MKLYEFSVKRPVFISMVSCIVLILGGVALKSLPIDLMPEISYPAVSVSTKYDDAAPEEVEELITKPLEQALSAVSGVKELRSISSEENSNIQILFNWNTNLDEGVADVRDRIDRAMRNLPEDIDRPTIMRFNSANMPIMRISVGTNMDLLAAQKFLEDQITYRLERIDGVASCDIMGGRTREIQVLFDEDKVRVLDSTMEEIIAKIGKGNVTSPAGNVREDRREVRIRTPWTFSSLDELRNLVIAKGMNGEPVYLRDVAEVRDTVEKVTRFVRVNGQNGIQMALYKQSGSNTVSVANAVEKEIEKINADFPQIKMHALINSAEYIILALNTVADAAVSGGILAILVLLFFLRNIRSTLIIAVSIPMSIIATFVLIYFCGFTLNIMTLGGLALGIGMLVDNSIVVLENITRLKDSGMSSHDAAIQGTKEVTPAIVASTLTTFAVFLPLLFIQGMAGIMFREFSMVVVFSLGCSLLVAISLVPMLSGRFLKSSIQGESHKSVVHWMFDCSGRVINYFDEIYYKCLLKALRNRWKMVLIPLFLVGLSFFLVPIIGKELMPKSDEGVVNVTLECEVGTSPEVVNDTVKLLEPEIVKVCGRDLKGYITNAGASSWRGTGGHTGRFSIRLVNRKQRERSDEEIANQIAVALQKFPGVKIRSRSGQGLFMMGANSGGESVTIDIRGYDMATSGELGAKLIAITEAIDGVTDAKLSRDDSMPENRIGIDRNKAADMDVPVESAANALRTIIAGTSAGNYRESGDEYKILVKVKDAEFLTLEQILNIGIKNNRGELVVLGNLLDFNRHLGAVAIERKNQERVLTVSANIFNRDIGSVVNDIQEKIKDLPLPPSFSILFAGDYEELVKAFRELGFAFALALVLVYMVMACQFESFIDPVIVMFSVPLAIVGVLTALFVSNSTFNIQSFIGCIMLAGIVVNNAILLVDTANMLMEVEHMPLFRAISLAGKRRLRPILMTTLTTVLGLLPLALGLGDGGESQAPMAQVVIGGLLSSTFITLFFIPVIFYSFNKSRKSS